VELAAPPLTNLHPTRRRYEGPLFLMGALLFFLPGSSFAQDRVTLEPIVVTAPDAPSDSTESTLGAAALDGADLSARRAAATDTGRLLRDVPGVSLYGAGGISSLPVIHGLADDRLRVQVDGADLMPACPNHMNSALSYADPTRVAEVAVFSGATPVSVGGDSIGGSIQVESAPPELAGADAKHLARGVAGTFFRSNGNAHGHNLGATLASRALSLSYSESSSQSDNFKAARAFKPVAPGREGGSPIPADEVASSAYRGSTKRSLALAGRLGSHALQLELSRQTVDFEGFPNQRMDMTSNDNRLLNLRYKGEFTWGDLEARFIYQATRHAMDMGPDRYSYGTGMPMETQAWTQSGSIKGNIVLSERDTLRVGVESQRYILYDWWPPVGGAMGPNAFWNVDYGRREKLDAFAEWEARWSERWLGLIGLRSDTIWTHAGPVQGYDNGLAAVWGDDAVAFNARKRERTDANWDLSALVRFTQRPSQAYEGGYSRKTRSPNLYQRYPWSTNPMAALMNNLLGDGDGYLGNTDLRPEVAHTISLSGEWRDPARRRWSLRAAGHYTYVQDFVDARRCDFGQCSAANAAAAAGFVLLQYVNQAAQLYGVDLSGRALVADAGPWGSLTATAAVEYLGGKNITTGDGLFNLMPPSAKLALIHRRGGWTSRVELLAVADKSRVSRVRNEIPVGGYWLADLHTSYEWTRVSVDVGVENLFNRFYSNPLGGAYVGQGSSMTTSGIPWGTPIPGMGRSFNVALNLHF
jgi:iron complex outermembrane receptor protein